MQAIDCIDLTAEIRNCDSGKREALLMTHKGEEEALYGKNGYFPHLFSGILFIFIPLSDYRIWDTLFCIISCTRAMLVVMF